MPRYIICQFDKQTKKFIAQFNSFKKASKQSGFTIECIKKLANNKKVKMYKKYDTYLNENDFIWTVQKLKTRQVYISQKRREIYYSNFKDIHGAKNNSNNNTQNTTESINLETHISSQQNVSNDKFNKTVNNITFPAISDFEFSENIQQSKFKKLRNNKLIETELLINTTNITDKINKKTRPSNSLFIEKNIKKISYMNYLKQQNFNNYLINDSEYIRYLANNF